MNQFITGILPPEKNKVLIVAEKQDRLIPLIGLNQTNKGYFTNYYLNTPKTIFGSHSHLSRHSTLIAFRIDKYQNLYSFSDGVEDINKRSQPETISSASFTSDFFASGIYKEKFSGLEKNLIKIPMNIINQGIKSVVIVWPKQFQPTDNDLDKYLIQQNTAEDLLLTIRPNGFTNRLIIGLYKVKQTSITVYLFEGVANNNSTEFVTVPGSHPVTIGGTKKGNN